MGQFSEGGNKHSSHFMNPENLSSAKQLMPSHRSGSLRIGFRQYAFSILANLQCTLHCSVSNDKSVPLASSGECSSSMSAGSKKWVRPIKFVDMTEMTNETFFRAPKVKHAGAWAKK